MGNDHLQLTRREALIGLGAGVSTLALARLRAESGPCLEASRFRPAALLDEVAWNLIELEPGTATSLGIDVGEKAYLRGQMSGASPEFLAKYAANLRTDLARVRAFDKSGLDPATLTSSK